MIRRSLATLAYVACLPACSCALDHVVPIDAWREDGGPGTACVSPEELWGVGAEPPWPDVDCLAPNAAESCSLALSAYSPDGLAVSTCERGLCRRGDRCTIADHFQACYCAGVVCGYGQICVNDGSGEHCVDICLRERTLARACAPLSRPLPWARWANPVPTSSSFAQGCRLWAQAFAPAGTRALATVDPALSGGRFCGMGDACNGPYSTMPGAPPYPLCTCDGVQCALDQVCVTDELGDPTPHCVPACWPSP